MHKAVQQTTVFTVFPPESAVSTSFRPSRGKTPREVAPHHLAARTSRDRAARDSCGSTRPLLQKTYMNKHRLVEENSGQYKASEWYM